MTSDLRQGWRQTRTALVADLLVASIVTASFLITVAPLGTASAATGTMDCCVGKPGHVPGSCATGLLASSKKSHFESPASFDNDPASSSAFSVAVVPKAGAGQHCHAPATGPPTSTNSVFAGAEATSTTTELASGSLTVEATAAPTSESGLTSIHSVNQPCTKNCSACSTGITRRPHEQSALSFAARPHLALVRRPSPINDLQIRPLNGKWLQLLPRGPPA